MGRLLSLLGIREEKMERPHQVVCYEAGEKNGELELKDGKGREDCLHVFLDFKNYLIYSESLYLILL